MLKQYLAGLIAASAIAGAQSVISAHSGVLHYIEGSVFIDNQPVHEKAGRFPQIPEGAQLRTEHGRAEILLTPGVFLRVDNYSAVRMLSTDLSNTRVEFVEGAAVLDERAGSGTDPLLFYKDHQIHPHSPGLYHIDSIPGELRVATGQAEVSYEGRSVTIKAGRVVELNNTLESRASQSMPDSLDDWDRERSQAVAADNVASAQTQSLSDVVDSWQNGTDTLPADLGVAGGLPLTLTDPLLNLPYSRSGLFSPLNPISIYSLPVILGYTSPYIYAPRAGIYSGITPCCRVSPIRPITPGRLPSQPIRPLGGTTLHAPPRIGGIHR